MARKKSLVPLRKNEIGFVLLSCYFVFPLAYGNLIKVIGFVAILTSLPRIRQFVFAPTLIS